MVLKEGSISYSGGKFVKRIIESLSCTTCKQNLMWVEIRGIYWLCKVKPTNKGTYCKCSYLLPTREYVMVIKVSMFVLKSWWRLRGLKILLWLRNWMTYTGLINAILPNQVDLLPNIWVLHDKCKTSIHIEKIWLHL